MNLLHPTAPAMAMSETNCKMPNADVIAGWHVVKSSLGPTRLVGLWVPCGRPPLLPPREVEAELLERSGSGRFEMSKLSMIITWHSAMTRVPENMTRLAKKTGIKKCVEGPVADIVKAKLETGNRRIPIKKTVR